MRSNKKAIVVNLPDSSPESSPARPAAWSFVRPPVEAETGAGDVVVAEERRSLKDTSEEELRIELRKLDVLQELQRRKNLWF